MSEEKNETSGSATNDSDDLNELLKSALDDFDNPLPTSSESPSTVPVKNEESTAKLQENFEQKFMNLFLNDVDDATFANKITDLLTEVKNEIDTRPSDETSDENLDTVSQAINSLIQNSEEIKNIATDDLPGGINFDAQDPDTMYPVMEQMFQMMMSKEVLYPSLLAVKDQYPTWLAENKTKTSAAEVERYTKQYEIIKKICLIFESEDESDSKDVKQKRFINLMGLLEEMSALGQPPADFAPLPSVPGATDVPDNCNPM